ncbi:M23 family metallopeptidase [bacterium]|nr:M23 family metallopeptidase [bacterium]MBP9809838.1 M23 family metallopeptidase [bacterium]
MGIKKLAARKPRHHIWCTLSLLLATSCTVACSGKTQIRSAANLNATKIQTAGSSSPAATAAADALSAKFKALKPEPNRVGLLTEDCQPFSPMNLVQAAGDNLVFLGGDCLYISKNSLPDPSTGGFIIAQKINSPAWGKPPALPIPVHEFANLVYAPTRNSIIVLDKSGDLFEFDLTKKAWSVLRTNVPISGSPDPEFIDLCLSEQNNILNLLDPERNQIWRLRLPAQTKAKSKSNVSPLFEKTFPEVMPWRLKPGDASVAECIAITFDKRFSLLKQFGQIITIEPLSPAGSLKVHQTKLPIKSASGALGTFGTLGKVRASRMISGDKTIPLYVVERQNNRVLAVDKESGSTKAFNFPANSSLRGLLPLAKGFWIIDNNTMAYRDLGNPNPAGEKREARENDPRLAKLSAPIKGMKLPKHSGVYPGARRLYRYGVHEGLDLFNDRTHIAINTPVIAAGAGKIVRADANFVDMNRGTFNRVMSDCVNEHRTSDKNEDLFRGCQVWIDHGNNMITRYAHLNKINPKIRVGQTVKPGDLIGFVGVSGTGQNLPGRAKYPHLHFEIWLDGKYLGYGLTPAETVGIFEDIFESPQNSPTK